MSLSAEAFTTLSNHWAISAVGVDSLERADRFVNERLAHHAVGKQIAFSFAVDAEDDPLLERAALAYEMAAIDSSPRKPSSTMRIFSSAEYCLRVARRISLMTFSAGSFCVPDFR